MTHRNSTTLIALFQSVLFASTLASAEPTTSVAHTEPRAGYEPTEIVATGDSVVFVAPDHATITASLSQTAATAADATTKLDATTTQLREALKPFGAKWQFHLRDERYAPSGQAAGPLTASAAVTVRRELAVETDEPYRVGQGIDLLTKLPGVTVTDVSFSVRNASGEQLDLLTKAASIAKTKAEKIAAGLGVKLGRLVSAQLTEEPDGAAIRERMAQGESPLHFQDQRLKLFVTVRYEAIQ